MRTGPLTLFKRMRPASAGVLLASLHWQDSITWRWSLTYSRFKPNAARGFRRHRTYTYKPGWNGMLMLNLPLIGCVRLDVQPNMFSPGWKAYS